MATCYRIGPRYYKRPVSWGSMSTVRGSLTYQNVDRLCGAVRMEVAKPKIDLRQVTFIEPFALIYLGMFISHHNSKGQYFTVLPPKSLKAQQYLSSQNFWQRCNIRTGDKLRNVGTVARLTSFNDIVSFHSEREAPEEIADRVYNLLARSSFRLNVMLTAELVGELVDNFVRHSESPAAACVVQHYPNIKRLDFAIGDCGIGIRRSLS